MRKDRHHLLEIILWPNHDGTYTKIVNSAKRLQQLGIYDNYKMCIELEHGEHTALHNRNLNSERRDKIRMRAISNNPTKNKEVANKISKALTGKARDADFRKKNF